MNVYQPDRKRRGRARERYFTRQQRQMATRRETPFVSSEAPDLTPPPDYFDPVPLRDDNVPVMSRAPHEPRTLDPQVLQGQLVLFMRDAAWYMRRSPLILGGAVGFVALIIAAFFGVYLLGGRVFPNVWALGVPLGGLTVEDASLALSDHWARSVRIELIDGARTWTATPAQLGMTLDAAQTFKAAQAAGLSGIPFGANVLPVINLNFLTAQDFLLDLTDETKILPYNAGFRWEAGQLVGVRGSDGRFLDIAATMASLQGSLPQIADRGVLTLIMSTIPPDVRDPSAYLAQARAFAIQDFSIRGYDPFTDEHFAWSTDRDTLTSWLEVNTNGLSLREDVFANFVAAQTRSLQATNDRRYIEPLDTISKMQQAIRNSAAAVDLRIRYTPGTYTVQRGDTGYRIAGRLGIPFYNLQIANPGRDWERPLSIGEVVNVPSPDITLPVDPVPNKRIVVNLRTQMMTAFENGQPVFEWSIASGIDRAPTSPGVFQIISHAEVASGSSYELCSSLGCAQWEMYWFMGIYEIVPGLVNGFHGSVLLPNGRLLGDGNVGYPATYGCIMSDNDNARALYEWAEKGTIVEIIGRDYPPRSALGESVWGVQANT